MRSLVFLVAVTYCSAQLLPYTAPWVLPPAKLITTADDNEDLKSVALPSPYFHPYSHPLFTPYSHPIGTPYLHSYTHSLATPSLHPFGYAIKADSTLKATEFPYIWEAAEPEATPAVEEARRRRRDVKAVQQIPLPYLHAIPAVGKTTVETKQFEKIEAATPADTTKLELTTKEHEIAVPTIKYVQPVVNYKPLTYTAYSHPVLPYHYGLHALPYSFPQTPLIKLEE